MPDLFVDMAEAMGIQTTSSDDAVTKVLAAIRTLSSDVGIPKNLKELVSGREGGWGAEARSLRARPCAGSQQLDLCCHCLGMTAPPAYHRTPT